MNEKSTSKQSIKVNVPKFLNLANQEDWTEFDRLAVRLSENSDYLKWTASGLSHPEINARDLAITLLEHTLSLIFNATWNTWKVYIKRCTSKLIKAQE